MEYNQVTIYTTHEGIEIIGGMLDSLDITIYATEDPADFMEFLSSNTPNWDFVDESLMYLAKSEPCIKLTLARNEQGEEKLTKIKEKLLTLPSLTPIDLGRLAIEESVICEDDWAEAWKQYFKPVRAGTRLVIKPAWDEYSAKSGEVILTIDPGAAFGTGTHQSTFLCLKSADNVVKGNEKVLDLGCGSGILSIAAMLLGAKSATSVDIDQNAARIAKENAEANGFGIDKYKTMTGNVLTDESVIKEIGTGYDIIFANIVADVIIALSPKVKTFMSKKASFICSGIIKERAVEVINAVEKQGLKLYTREDMDEWVMMVFIN